MGTQREPDPEPEPNPNPNPSTLTLIGNAASPARIILEVLVLTLAPKPTPTRPRPRYTASPAQIVLEVLEGTAYDLVRAGTDGCDGGMLGVLVDILSGCAYLHACSPPLLHRDLKPPNVLHDEKMRCKLCDFGTALELLPSKPLPTEWIGSQLYVAPEIDRAEPYSLPADVFSFGVLGHKLYPYPYPYPYA